MNNYTAIQIANYIVWFVNENKLGEVTPLKLQKMLYYVAAQYFKKNSIRLFQENIEKWKYGPVTPSVYHGFKSQGIEPILEPITTLIEDSNSTLGYKRVEFDPKLLIEDQKFKEIADSIIEKLVVKDAFKLVEITHKENAWKRLEGPILEGLQGYTYSDFELNQADFSI